MNGLCAQTNAPRLRRGTLRPGAIEQAAAATGTTNLLTHSDTKRFPGEGCRALFAQRLEQSPIKREGYCDASDEKSYRGQPID